MLDSHQQDLLHLTENISDHEGQRITEYKYRHAAMAALVVFCVMVGGSLRLSLGAHPAEPDW